MNVEEILLKNWGYTAFREKQQSIIQSVLEGKDTLALLPTGGGKSVCFQVPALAMEGVCIVVSPLIALMKDQVENLNARGIKAISINSTMRKREIDIALDNIVYGDYKFLYVSPERIETEIFKERVKKMKINLIAIDEAHCISQWGYDFRPSYLKINQLREIKPKVPILALTATATAEVVIDIQKQLNFKEPNVIQRSFERKNLAYIVQNEENQLGRLLKVLEGVKGTGIVYVGSRNKSQRIADYLKKNGHSATFYHAGLTHEERNKAQSDWMHNKTRVIVATNAFGMGIDKPNVRFVVHLDIPNSIEAYFQEAGRGGRDGKKAYAVMLTNKALEIDLTKRVEQQFPSIEFIKNTYQALANYLQLPIGSGINESFHFDISDFSNRFNFSVLDSYNALKFLEKEGYILLSEAFHSPSKIHFKLNKEDLYKFQVAHIYYDTFIRSLLRSHEGLFDGFVKINEFDLAKKFKSKKDKITELLKKLQELEVIEYIEQSSLPELTLLKDRVDQKALRISKEHYADRKKIAFDKMKAIINYLEATKNCRSQLLLEYFDEQQEHRCGICDVCIELNKLELSELQFENIQIEIKNKLIEKPMSIDEITKLIKRYSSKDIVKVCQYMLDNDDLQLDKANRLTIVSSE